LRLPEEGELAMGEDAIFASAQTGEYMEKKRISMLTESRLQVAQPR